MAGFWLGLVGVDRLFSLLKCVTLIAVRDVHFFAAYGSLTTALLFTPRHYGLTKIGISKIGICKIGIC